MKNRNDDRKLIFREQRKKLVDRLFLNIQKINNRKLGGHLSKMTTQKRFNITELHNFKDIQQCRRYQIVKQNQRMIQRICDTKHSVATHLVPKLKTKRTQITKILERKNIEQQNKRLCRVINKVSPIGKHSLRCYSLPANSLRC